MFQMPLLMDPPLGGVSGTCHQEEGQEIAQDTLKEQCLLAGPGILVFPRGAGEEVSQGASIETAASATHSQISVR